MTIPELFQRYPWLNQKEVASRAEISYDCMRQYARGASEPSYTRRLHIIQAVRDMGKELAAIPKK